MLALQPHKSACHACGHSLGAEALFCPNCGTAKRRDLSEDPLVGARVGERYLLIEHIGQGASGTIYRGEHVTLRRKVCVKVLHHELSRDDLAIERFRRQATTVSDLDNEHIVAVHDFGRAPDGRLYIAMEYLEGETLDERIESRGRLDVDDAVSILTQLGEALIEAHAIGYVHRDLRPRNLFLSVRRGKANFLKLLDFGLSKLVASEGSADSTSLGMTFGDPHYMSPEQARGEPVDRRADIYSMGCIAYQMFTGAPPFTGEKVFAVLSRHVEEEPVRLADKADVPDWVNATVMRCLAKNPDDRFATVFRLVEALREGAATGKVMDEGRARRRETSQPESVSRIIERFSDRIGADGKMDDADDTRTAKDAAEKSQLMLPALPPASPAASPAASPPQATPTKPFDGGRTALGIGAAGSIVSPVDDETTEPSSAPIISGETGETGDAVPSHIVNEPTPAPRVRDLPPVVVRAPSGPLGTPRVTVREDEEPPLVAENALANDYDGAADDSDDDEEFDDSDNYDYDYEDEPRPAPEREPAAVSAAGGKRARRPSASNESGLGISSAWYADGDALGDSSLSLEDEELERLAKARARRSSRASLSATSEVYYDETESKLKWVFAAVGGAALLGLALFLFVRGGGGDTSATDTAAETAAANEAAQGSLDSAKVAEMQPTVTADASGALPEPAPVVAKDVKPRKVAVNSTRPKDVRPTDRKPRDTAPVVKNEGGDEGGDIAATLEPLDTGDTGDTGGDKTEDPADEKPKRASAEDKKRADFYAQIGKKALSRGDIPTAAKEFRRALALNPSNSRAITGLGEIALKQGSYAAAVKHLSRAAKMRGKSAYVHSLLGDAKLGAGDRSGATSSYRRALEIKPDYAPARRGLDRLGLGG